MLLCCFVSVRIFLYFSFFFFNDTATTEIYTLSLHDALPISLLDLRFEAIQTGQGLVLRCEYRRDLFAATTIKVLDRKSTRLNSSHSQISYAVFCLKKKKKHLPA